MLVKLKTSSLDNLSRVYSQLKESSVGSKPVRLRKTTPDISKPPHLVAVVKLAYFLDHKEESAGRHRGRYQGQHL